MGDGTPVALARGVRWRAVVLGFAFVLGLVAVVLTARVSPVRHAAAAIAIQPRGAPERVVAVFIDSLSRDVATNTQIMPELGKLAREGAAFDVEPCRDQLTYLCIRAALTGHDDSSLLAVADNFRPSQEGPPETLLSALVAQGRRVSVIGTSDYHPYRRALFLERPLAKHEETPEHVLALLGAAERDDAQLIIVSLGSGDMTAHAHGGKSPEYAAVFRRLDATVGAILRSLAPGTSLIVFGDHGHDALGRHLPGTSAKTWAVYRGRPFRAGVHAELALTDHRALLGVLLGLPTEAGYRGPALDAIFEPAWSASNFPNGLPRLHAPPVASAGVPVWRWLGVLGLAGSFVVGAWLLDPQRRWAVAALAALAAAAASAVGIGYDALRNLVHDHGDSPERGLSLLVPLALGGALSFVARPERSLARTRSGGWLPGAAAGALLVTFLLLLPTAYYYGARRAVVLAAVVAVLAVVLEAWRAGGARLQERVLPTLGLVFVAVVLLTLYQVKQLGPETAGAATWALDSPLYTRAMWLPLLACKLLIYDVFIAPRASHQPWDVAGAALLCSLCALVELRTLELPRAAYAALFAALLLGVLLARQRAAASLFAGSLLLLGHLYGHDLSRLAPIQTLLTSVAVALWAWPRLGFSEVAQKVMTGLTVVVGVYLMFWPTVGFHLAGIDFGYMFQWLPETEYERFWRLIALGLVVKLALPLVLVLAVAREQLRDRTTLSVVSATLSAKVALLALMIAAYAAGHTMASQQALAMLAELVLLLFAVACALMALPRAKPAWQTSGATLGSSQVICSRLGPLGPFPQSLEPAGSPRVPSRTTR